MKRIQAEWACPRCQAKLKTFTKLLAIPTHQCGSKRTPQPFHRVDGPEFEVLQ